MSAPAEQAAPQPLTRRALPEIGLDNRFITMLHRAMPAALVLHGIFLALFIVLAVKPLIYFNIGSVTLYGLCIYLLTRKRYDWVIMLTWFEIVGHAATASMVLGFESGFQYYVIVLVPLIFVNAARSNLNKIVFSSLLCLLYLAMDLFIQRYHPFGAATVKAITVLRCFNIVGCFALLGYLSYVYRQVVVRVETRLTKTNENLQRALSEVRTLRGILPICSFCKKIRDDKGYWNQVDIYINEHSEADVSHSVCPECLAIQYPDFKKRNP